MPTFRLCKHAVLIAGAALLSAGAIADANAVPNLQIDIIGGAYDAGNEDVFTTSDTFTLRLLGVDGSATNNPNDGVSVGTNYFFSVAVTPAQTTSADLGSFSIDGTSFDVTDDMVFGTPPIAAVDSEDLQSHGIFETFFLKQAFTFQDTGPFAANKGKGAEKDVQNDPGSALDPCGVGDKCVLFVDFAFDVSGLNPGTELHFDLFQEGNQNNGKFGITDFAPFSHDATTQPPGFTPPPGVDIPEPTSLGLLGAGLLGIGAMLLRRRRPRS